MTETPQTTPDPITAEDRAMLDGWIEWTAGHVEPAADLSDAPAIMGLLDGLMAQDFVKDYGPEEIFALGMVWGEALRLSNPGWSWVRVPTEEGTTFALDASTDGVERLVAPGQLFLRRSEMPGALIEPRQMETMLMAELDA
ncbi:hypothetical protein [Jannaschia pohangensis]|uniref:DUF3806 domain-containing protein n=1 Tax=Jannaschia pohangensis TaxID=390807 RepID=A0A1I3HMC5_9RHOB|nr:hypothetical protein [Jannaschia pohangensis]SFI36650.1 hypothetical protein SAMN04488095_0648 [Jannaschia pohangensis]